MREKINDDLEMSHCPICCNEQEYYQRYPNYICKRCSLKATDKQGRDVKFHNVGIHGGCVGSYLDNNQPYEHQNCFIEGMECYAEEAYMGGIVYQVAG
jgi:hypothetical protein